MNKKHFHAAVAAALSVAPVAAFATNGMNLEGYGPIATGVGGASMAYDNGTAATMNNPATLGLMQKGDRLDLALGFLGPNITSSAPGAPDAKSSGNAYYMPALGYVRNNGMMTYGVGLFAQGGMGTEYGGDSFLAAGSGENVRSEVGVGRVVFPLSYSPMEGLNVAASVDYVFANMDLKMALPGAAFFDMAPGGSQTYGNVSGSMVDTFGGAFANGQLTTMNWARFDFSDNNRFTGEAKGDGFAGKLGLTFKVSDALTLGTAYHSKTSLGDLETRNARISTNVSGPATGGQPTTANVTGTLNVRDFQWPQMFAFGGAFKVNQAFTLLADYKWIDWSSVMKDFRMGFTADDTQADPTAQAFGLGGQTMDATLYQNWKNQNVFMFGGAFDVSKALTARAGVNVANNPVPDQYENPLFPATIKNSYTGGLGYSFGKASAVNVSLTYAPEVTVTNGSGVTTRHSQTNGQVMYSARF